MRERTLFLAPTEQTGFSFVQSTLCRMVTLSALVLFWVLAGSNLRAESIVDLPSEFGTVVFQTQGNTPAQLFIIANSHRSTISGDNGDATIQAQVETFQICEWLIRRRQVAMLLPEGFFGNRPATRPAAGPEEWLDSATLTRWLSDTSSFVNAEILLHEQYGINLQQVEDRELYQNVRDALLASQGDDIHQGLLLHGQIESLQKRRSAAILQRATALSQSGSLSGDVPKSSILTIGLAHLGDILEFIASDEVQPPANDIAGANLSYVPVSSNPDKRSIGITVIVPHSLLERLPPEPGNRI